MNNKNKMLSPSIKMLSLLEDIFEGVSADVLWKTTFFYKNTKTESEYNSLIKSLNLIKKELQEKDNLQEEKQKMLDYGFSPSHVLLYLQAPEVSPLKNQTTREEYLKKWNYENNFKRKNDYYEIYDRGKTAVGSLLAIGGLAFIGGGTALGFAINNKEIIDTISSMSSHVDNLSLINEALLLATPDKALQAFFAVAGVTTLTYLKFKSKVSDSLQDGIYNKLSYQPEKREKQLFFLNEIPSNEHHLLSHFSKEELEVFLLSNEKERYNMLEKFPPFFKQRADAILSDPSSSFSEKIINYTKLSTSSWDDKFHSPMSLSANNLKMQINNMKNNSKPSNKKSPILKSR